MSSFTDSEKVEYALKTTLNITMSKFGYAPFNETPAPPRVFPSNVMSKDLIKYGEGDLDENGAYVSGHSQSGTIDTTLTTYESVLKYYKIVCPVTKKVSAAQLKDVLGSTSIQNVLGRDITSIEFSYEGGGGSGIDTTNFWTKPVKNNFHTLAYFRGHYLDEDNMPSKFNYANSNYKGINLAWNHIAAGTDVSAAIDADGNGTDDTKIVPHLKLFLQVQTAFQIGAANKENQCFGHTMMKNMLGLDFKIPVQVNVGEVSGDPNVTATALSDITGPGVAAGNEWYTQSTAGTINFYAVGHTVTAVDNARSPTDNPIDSSAPLVTFLKYTGDHAGVGGLGGGGGGGGAGADPIQAVTSEPSWTDNSITVESNLKIERPNTEEPRIELIRNNSTNTFGGDNYQDWAIQNSGGNFQLISGHLSNGNTTVLTSDGTNVGIGETDITSNYGRLTLKGGGILLKQSTVYQTRPSGPQNTAAVLDYEIASYGAPGSYPNDMGFLRLRAGNNSNHSRIDICGYTPGGTDDTHKNITFWTAATERMRINGQGKVGIGVGYSTLHNSTHQLQVSSGCKAGYFFTPQSIAMGSGFKFSWGSQDSTEAAIEGHASNNTMKFYTGSSERMRLTDTGLGIGTTSPRCNLHVSKDISISSISSISDCYLHLGGTEWTSNQLCLIGLGHVTAGSTHNPPAYMGYIATSSAAYSNGALIFGTRSGTGAADLPSERMRIDSEGNVGIGTTSPDTKLHLGSGAIRIDLNSTDYLKIDHNQIYRTNGDLFLNYTTQNDVIICGQGGNVGIGLTDPASPLEIKCTAGGNTQTSQWTGAKGLRLTRNNDGHAWEIVNGQHNDLLFRNLNSSGAVYTDNVLLLDDNGNVGIGSAETPNYKLDVNGSLRVQPYATTISGDIDMDSSTYDINTYYPWIFPQGPMSAGNCITVKIGRGVHTSGTWMGGCCLVVTFVPSHYGYLGYSQYFVHHYSTRDDTTIGRVQCHGQWSYGVISLRGDRKYHYVIHEGGVPYLSGDSSFTTAETITVGSVVSQSWSDDRIKHNETKIINGLDVINKLNPLRYIKTMHKMYDKDHKFELEDDGTPIDTSGNKLGVNAWTIENGIIAQELEKIDELKHAVGKSTTQDASGNVIKTVKYNDVFVYNIAATQELYKENQELKTEVATLKSELSAIKQHLGL